MKIENLPFDRITGFYLLYPTNLAINTHAHVLNMDWEEIEDKLFNLMDNIEHRILTYKTNCPTKKKLKKFYDILEELKMPVGSENDDVCIEIIKNNDVTLGEGLRKANWENVKDYNLFKKTVEEQWQCIINFLY